jgi:hypothetical protein
LRVAYNPGSWDKVEIMAAYTLGYEIRWRVWKLSFYPLASGKRWIVAYTPGSWDNVETSLHRWLLG